jgi:hypothetical protein
MIILEKKKKEKTESHSEKGFSQIWLHTRYEKKI